MIEERELHRSVRLNADGFGVPFLDLFADRLGNADHVHAEGHSLEEELPGSRPEEHGIRSAEDPIQFGVDQPQTVVGFVFGKLQDRLRVCVKGMRARRVQKMAWQKKKT